MESPIYTSRISWNFYFPGIILLSFIYWFGESGLFLYSELTYLAIISLHRLLFQYKLTNKTVYAKTAFFIPRSREADISSIKAVNVKQGFLGMICNYGDVEFVLLPEGGGDILFKGVKCPEEVKRLAMGLLERAETKGG